MDFGWSNGEIGWKMANGQLLYLALDAWPGRTTDTSLTEIH